MGSLLSVKPILTVKEGEMAPLTRVRSLAAGIDYFCNFLANCPKIEDLAVEHTTNLVQADQLVERLSAYHPKERIYRSTVSPVLGVYGGPNALAVAILEAEKK
jgi:fatty acid-binding protein DegV